MSFKIVDIQIKDNPNFVKTTNNIIRKDIEKYKEKYSEYIMSYFLRYEIVKNDFISLHVDKNSLKILDNLFNKQLKLYKEASCKTIDKVIDFNKLKITQKKIILKNILSDSILIDDKNYICLNKEDRDKVYNLTNEILAMKGYEKFLQYVYKRIK